LHSVGDGTRVPINTDLRTNLYLKKNSI